MCHRHGLSLLSALGGHFIPISSVWKKGSAAFGWRSRVLTLWPVSFCLCVFPFTQTQVCIECDSEYHRSYVKWGWCLPSITVTLQSNNHRSSPSLKIYLLCRWCLGYKPPSRWGMQRREGALPQAFPCSLLFSYTIPATISWFSLSAQKRLCCEIEEVLLLCSKPLKSLWIQTD